MINKSLARAAGALCAALVLATTGVSAAVASPPNPERTVVWRTGIDGYTASFVGEYFGGKGLAAGAVPAGCRPTGP